MTQFFSVHFLFTLIFRLSCCLSAYFFWIRLFPGQCKLTLCYFQEDSVCFLSQEDGEIFLPHFDDVRFLSQKDNGALSTSERHCALSISEGQVCSSYLRRTNVLFLSQKDKVLSISEGQWVCFGSKSAWKPQVDPWIVLPRGAFDNNCHLTDSWIVATFDKHTLLIESLSLVILNKFYAQGKHSFSGARWQNFRWESCSGKYETYVAWHGHIEQSARGRKVRPTYSWARREEPEALESEESMSPLLSNELLGRGVKWLIWGRT